LHALLRGGIGLLIVLTGVPVAQALEDSDMQAPRDRAVFGFGGLLTREDMQRSANPLTVDYEKRAVIGAGYQHFFAGHGDFKLGWEAGFAARTGTSFSAELWGGGVARYDGFKIADRVIVSPAFTAGLSAVSRTHPGREKQLERRYDGNAAVLFYLGPEINVSLADQSDREVFWRLHHRSGGGHTLGNMKGAANANVVGFRYKF
jgi:hypothetical protein